jgi:hypothetical protein
MQNGVEGVSPKKSSLFLSTTNVEEPLFTHVDTSESRSNTALPRSILTAKLTAKPVDNSGF